jgi:hypothetical protein
MGWVGHASSLITLDGSLEAEAGFVIFLLLQTEISSQLTKVNG